MREEIFVIEPVVQFSDFVGTCFHGYDNSSNFAGINFRGYGPS